MRRGIEASSAGERQGEEHRGAHAGHRLASKALVGMGGSLALLLAACGTGAGDASPTTPATIDVPGSAIESLTNYRFTTSLTISSPSTGTSQIGFDGIFESPSSIQGTLSVTGGEYERLLTERYQRPASFDGIVIGEDAWWRAPGGQWQAGVKGYEESDPLVGLREYATPEFYLEALKFHSLTLPVADPIETMNSQRAYRVRLDKAGMISALRQGDEVRLYPDPVGNQHGPVGSAVVENAEYNLPKDIAVEAWFAVEGLYPLRIVISYSLAERESFILSGPVTLRMQLDITDRDAKTHIEPPIPQPSATPTSATPPVVQTPRLAVTATPAAVRP